jgi:hypothetical protein
MKRDAFARFWEGEATAEPPLDAGSAGASPSGDEKVVLSWCHAHVAFAEAARDPRGVKLLLEFRLQAGRESKIPPKGGTPAKRRTTKAG